MYGGMGMGVEKYEGGYMAVWGCGSMGMSVWQYGDE